MRKPLILAAVGATLLAGLPLIATSAAHAAAAPPFGTIWTVDTASNAIRGHLPSSSGSGLVVISGPHTGLDAPSGVAVSSNGKIFVANAGNNSITAYAAAASGDATPITTISGANTGLAGPSSILLSGGDLWVTDPAENLVESFTAGSHGNEFPAETIAGPRTQLDNPTAIAIGSDLPAVSVLNTPTGRAASITTFFTDSRGDIAPDDVISGGLHNALNHPTALFGSTFGSVWVANSGSNSIVQLFTLPGAPTETLRNIHGADTKLDHPVGLSQDALGDLVVANAGDGTVRTYAGSARGDAAPLRTLTDAGAAAGAPEAAQVFGDAPGQPTDVKVQIRGTKAHVSWQAPTSTGGGVAGYSVLKFRDDEGGGGSYSIGFVTAIGSIGGLEVDTHQTHITKSIKRGHNYIFAVLAVNAFGSSNPSKLVHAGILLPPGPPRKVTATTGKRLILVRWRSPAQNGGTPVRSYRVQYGRCVPGTKGCKFRTKIVKRFAAAAQLTGLTPGTTYHVRVLARNKEGLGKPSRVLNVTV